LAQAKSLFRWYQNPQLNVAALEAVIFQDRPTSRLIEFTAKSLDVSSVSNPVSSRQAVPQPPPTQTIPRRTVYHNITAEVRSMLGGIQTVEQMEDLQERLAQVGCVQFFYFLTMADLMLVVGGMFGMKKDGIHFKILPQL
jgi:hypothetical protein